MKCLNPQLFSMKTVCKYLIFKTSFHILYFFTYNFLPKKKKKKCLFLPLQTLHTLTHVLYRGYFPFHIKKTEKNICSRVMLPQILSNLISLKVKFEGRLVCQCCLWLLTGLYIMQLVNWKVKLTTISIFIFATLTPVM